MSKFLRALLIAAAATGVVAVIVNALDLDATSGADSGASSLASMDPDDLSEEDVDTLMNELASQLNL